MNARASILAGLALVILSTLNFQLSTFAQGSLTPPGAPAPTMKTLDQIEPRTPVSSAPFTINQPGSYYLTTNVAVASGDAITIAANGVTLDLNGFTISSTANPAAGRGVVLSGTRRRVTVLNGFIQGGVVNNGAGVYSGSGFASGISYSASPPANVRVAGVSVSGCQLNGIDLGNGESTVIEGCTVRTVGNYGIVGSTVEGSAAVDCGSVGISGDQVTDCRGTTGAYGVGISAGTVQNSYGYSIGLGISAKSAHNCYGETTDGGGLSASVAENCYGYAGSGSGDGLSATTALNCYGYANGTGGEGISATVAQGCYGYASGNHYGIIAFNALNCYSQSGSGGTGLFAYTAQNCYGQSTGTGGYGIYATTAQNCYGNHMGNGFGVYVEKTAQNCYGFSSASTGLFAFIASVCSGGTTTGTPLVTTHNVNSF